MRVSSVPPSTGMPVLPPEQPISAAPAQQEAPGSLPPFSPFDTAAFEAAYRRSVPVFLVIGELTEAFADPAVAAHLAERTIPVRLLPGERPDVELLCQRAGVLCCSATAGHFSPRRYRRPVSRSTPRACSSGSRRRTGAFRRTCPR